MKPILSSHRSFDGVTPLGPNHMCSFCNERKPHVIGRSLTLGFICEECCTKCYEIFGEHEARRAAEHLAAKNAARLAGDPKERKAV